MKQNTAPQNRVTGVHVYRRKRRGRSDTAAQAMENVLSRIGFDPLKYGLFSFWDEETKGLIRGCEAVALQGDKLCVRVPSVMHRQELYYAKKRIIDKLNQRLGRPLIKDIRFELGTSEQRPTQADPTEKQGGTLRGEYRPGKRNRSFGKRNG